MNDFKAAGNKQLLEIRGLVKGFPGVKALNSVDFSLRAGEIHALMGENGAGKSTLIKVITGFYQRDGGSITMEGESFQASSPMDASSKGISTVYQEVNLAPNLSVAENIYIGRQPMKFGRIDWKRLNKMAEDALKKLDLKLDVTQQLSTFSTAIQQMISIARALDISAKILILDEPTSSLDSAESAQLFKIMKKLRDEGMGIIFITHFLDQVYETSDRITILRNGNYVGDFETATLGKMDLITKMLGQELENIQHLGAETQKKIKEDKELLLEAKNISQTGKIEPFDMVINKGEVLGLAGLLGSGRTEIAKILFAIEKNSTGQLYMNGKEASLATPAQAIQQKMAFCPEDRKTEGILLDLTVEENILLAQQAQQSIFKRMSQQERDKIVNKYIKALKIKCSSAKQRAGTLSGGNQQKLIIARWLALNPELLILDEPTRGIDVGAKTEIEKMIFQLRDEGKSILFISSELEEETRCCNRVMVLKDRKVIGELEGSQITEKNIMQVIAEEGSNV